MTVSRVLALMVFSVLTLTVFRGLTLTVLMVSTLLVSQMSNRLRGVNHDGGRAWVCTLTVSRVVATTVESPNWLLSFRCWEVFSLDLGGRVQRSGGGFEK